MAQRREEAGPGGLDFEDASGPCKDALGGALLLLLAVLLCERRRGEDGWLLAGLRVRRQRHRMRRAGRLPYLARHRRSVMQQRGKGERRIEHRARGGDGGRHTRSLGEMQACAQQVRRGHARGLDLATQRAHPVGGSEEVALGVRLTRSLANPRDGVRGDARGHPVLVHGARVVVHQRPTQSHRRTLHKVGPHRRARGLVVLDLRGEDEAPVRPDGVIDGPLESTTSAEDLRRRPSVRRGVHRRRETGQRLGELRRQAGALGCGGGEQCPAVTVADHIRRAAELGPRGRHMRVRKRGGEQGQRPTPCLAASAHRGRPPIGQTPQPASGAVRSAPPRAASHLVRPGHDHAAAALARGRWVEPVRQSRPELAHPSPPRLVGRPRPDPQAGGQARRGVCLGRSPQRPAQRENCLGRGLPPLPILGGVGRDDRGG